MKRNQLASDIERCVERGELENVSVRLYNRSKKAINQLESDHTAIELLREKINLEMKLNERLSDREDYIQGLLFALNLLESKGV